ncbi:hypothetical protein CupriaWKF_31910 [Cupriavidus sp. WKF15]|uniref:hypothetical protein n=1 Tax=Cupriavidus sp. WKF15 TaxID=3032282 RepID=UPI0023E12088|nr:hypothetical protein [Cupriavidus sp. WKF15]WER50931.1 hypothetical protein CupriaWKF_31910 [Cupriavidus sp. WKF15]
MLSPHEIAALMVLCESEAHRELDPADIGALIERQLVRLEAATQEYRHIRVTNEGRRLLTAIGKCH